MSLVADVRQSHYQELKERLHHTLLNRLNLDRLNRVGRAEAEPELRGLIIGLLDAETHTTPLSLAERESLITDVLHELFGLGPLEALLADPTVSDILVNRSNSIYVERRSEERRVGKEWSGRCEEEKYRKEKKQRRE